MASNIPFLLIPAGTTIYRCTRSPDSYADLVTDDDGNAIPPAEYTLAVGALASVQPAVVPGKPINTVPPSIVGTAQQGQTLTALTGTWSGGNGVFSYQWGYGTGDGTLISGAETGLYTAQVADVGEQLWCDVTTSNATGPTTVRTNLTAAVVASGSAPANSTLPTFIGTPQVGQTATITRGTFSGSPAPTLVSEVERDGVPVDDTDGLTYTFVEADIGAAMRVHVVATNAGGSAEANSLPLGPVVAAPSNTITILWMGQSNMQYVLGTVSTWDGISAPNRPTVPNPNNMLFVGTKQGRGVGGDDEYELWPVTTANVAAKNVSAAMGVLAATLDYIMPGQKFCMVDGAVSGTGRAQLQYDGYIEGRTRDWAEFEGIVEFTRAQVGEFTAVFEQWWASDIGDMTVFGQRQMPLYATQYQDGSAVILGTNNIDHTLWDVVAAPSAHGRGLFARDTTKLVMTEARPEYNWDRKFGVRAFCADTRVQSFLGHLGPSMMLGAWEGDAHPYNSDPLGGIYTIHAWTPPILKAAGFPIQYPSILRVDMEASGAYADVIVALPNGGTLTTTRLLEGRAADPSPLDDEQAIMGFEVCRAGEADTARLAFVPLAKTGYATKYRATITIHNSGTGSGVDRYGVIRIVPLVPFATGDKITYLKDYQRGIGTDRRDVHMVWLNYMIETVPAWRDVSASYPFPGINIEPLMDTVIVDLSEAPADEIEEPIILANNEWATEVIAHESSAFTPDGNSAVYVICSIGSKQSTSSGLGSGAELITTATTGAAGRADGVGTGLTLVAMARRNRVATAVYRMDDPVAAAQTIQINYATGTGPLCMRMLVLEIPNADPGAPANDPQAEMSQSGSTYTSRTLTPEVTSAHQAVLYIMSKNNGGQTITCTDAPEVFQDDNGKVSGNTGSGQLWVGFEVPGAAGVQSTTISWANGTNLYHGIPIVLNPLA